MTNLSKRLYGKEKKKSPNKFSRLLILNAKALWTESISWKSRKKLSRMKAKPFIKTVKEDGAEKIFLLNRK
jgi:hypothetical protein